MKPTRFKPHTWAGMLHATARRTKQTQALVAKVLRVFLSEVMDETWRSGRVAIPGFATFTVKRRKARKVVNPGNPERLHSIPCHESVGVRATANWRRK